MFMRGSNERKTSSILAEHNNGPDTGCEDNELDAMLDNGLTVIAAHVWAGVADPVGTTRTDAAGPVGTASARLKGYRGDEATSSGDGNEEQQLRTRRPIGRYKTTYDVGIMRAT
ncbi:hypothetical protein B0H10DRAFT_1966065 [Mycena sp. CBHHK59/15]|nr:hypothetical protein B0H10DRAFT_1970786 [Mycena sp. CBHHK59/15]KAJ6563513.1 hypothetical protein B0H10DRAFT_1966065 [Mycena sp. CBHHK59/15]